MPTFGCLVVIGSTAQLKSTAMKDSFEYFRRGQRTTEIITFDELFKKVEMLLNLLEGRGYHNSRIAAQESPRDSDINYVSLSLAWSTSVQAALVGHWTFNNGTADDSSGSGNNGMLLGTPLPKFSNDVPSQLGGGQSLSLIGDDQHFEQRVEVPTSSSLDIAGAITLAAWVKPTGAGWDAILAKSPSDGSSPNHAGSFEFRIENGGRRLQFLHQQGGVNDTVGYSSTGTVNSGSWSHVAVTVVDGAAVNFYINGALAGTAVHGGNFGSFTTSPLYIGNRGDFASFGTPFDGAIDDVRIYNEALTAAQIQDLFGPPLEEHPGLAGLRARASSEFLADGRRAMNAVNNNGIQGKAHGTSPAAAMWLTDGVDTAPEFNVDLGAVHTVDQLRVWNYNENANPTCCLDRGVKTADIYVAGADGVFGATPVISGQSFARAPGVTEDFSQVISLGGVQARYIKIDITENHGDPSFTGLSELKVTGSVVAGLAPIPATVSQVSSQIAGFDRGSAQCRRWFRAALCGCPQRTARRYDVAQPRHIWRRN